MQILKVSGGQNVLCTSSNSLSQSRLAIKMTLQPDTDLRSNTNYATHLHKKTTT